MDAQTQDKLDRMFRLVDANRQQLAELKAINMIQNHVIIALLNRVDSLANDLPDIVETYEDVRTHALAVAEHARRRDSFEALLKLTDAKFMGIYR
jgi:hypothetical protein